MRPSAPAFTSISLLLAATARAGDISPDPARVAALEMEATLAKRPAIYLVLDPQRRALEVRARGTLLDTIPLLGIELVSQQPLIGARPPASPHLPAVWTVANGPGDSDREVVEPATLRPAPKEGEEEPTPTPADTTSAPTPTPTPVPDAPSSYRVSLSDDLDVWVAERLPPQSRWAMFLAAVRDGLARLKGEGKDHAPAVILAMSHEDGQRLHHLMRTGTAILVIAEM